MDWRDYITSDPAIGRGKPIFRGTRFKVEFLLKLMAGGWDAEKIAYEYPGVTEDHMRAAIAFAVDMLDEESFVASAQARAA
jgi:uncharacterized protein (DUF433 family)